MSSTPVHLHISDTRRICQCFCAVLTCIRMLHTSALCIVVAPAPPLQHSPPSVCYNLQRCVQFTLLPIYVCRRIGRMASLLHMRVNVPSCRQAATCVRVSGQLRPCKLSAIRYNRGIDLPASLSQQAMHTDFIDQAIPAFRRWWLHSAAVSRPVA